MIQNFELDVEGIGDTTAEDLINSSDANFGGNEQNDQGENDIADMPGADSAQIEDLPQKKKIERKPIPKLDTDRLCGPRGIGTLPDELNEVQFKGKGHEESDLNLLISKLEHWAHRLMPNMRFDDTLHRISELGHKRPVQTYLTKMRLDMPVLNKDYISRELVESPTHDPDEPMAQNAPVSMDVEVDEALGLEPGIPDLSDLVDIDGDDDLSAQSFVVPLPPPAPPTLTDEQKERIEKNKQAALARRKARESSAVHSTEVGCAVDADKTCVAVSQDADEDDDLLELIETQDKQVERNEPEEEEEMLTMEEMLDRILSPDVSDET